jgi:hypothetical protein
MNRGDDEAVQKGVIGFGVGPHEVLTLRAATSQHVELAREYLSG